MDTILAARALDAGYNGNTIVRNIQIDLHAGEILVLIGPNGTGKTTILRTLSGQLPPVRGEVYLKGRELRKISERERSRTLSLLMTGRVDPELMTCEDVVSIGRYPYTGFMGRLSGHDREIMERSMEMAHVTELRDRFFHQLSDGQRQRVLLARAICQEPKVLIMDEPTSFLDIRHKLELLQILQELVKERQIAVIASLHELELVRKIADTVICVKNGQAEPGEETEKVFERDRICGLFDLSEQQYQFLKHV